MFEISKEWVVTSPIVVGNIYENLCRSLKKTVLKKIRPKKSKSKEGKPSAPISFFATRKIVWLKREEETVFYPLRYQDIDGYNWRCFKEYLPEPFDLVWVKTERNTLPGWHDGNKWCVRKLQSDENVIVWRKRKDEI